MRKVIKWCAVKNRWVGMVFYTGGMVKEFFYGKKPKMRQLKNLTKKARHQISINSTSESPMDARRIIYGQLCSAFSVPLALITGVGNSC